VEAIQRVPATSIIAKVKAGIIARRGIEAKNIAKVAAARELLTLIFYGMRDGHIRIGGWWPHKDITSISAALAQVTQPLHLVVCGTPLDEDLLARWRSLPRVRVHTMPGPVGEHVLRLVYAAVDATLVARRPGVGKESGLVMDAARLGIPLIVSDHDPALTGRLTGQPWAWLFPAGDPAALADVLDRLAAGPPARPGSQAPHMLGMLPAAEQATFLTDAYARLAKERR
jgi:glycosyltransferase involved in cell wall biosynthesis